jgi:urea transporter
MNYPFEHFAKSILNSSAQIMLQKKVVTGLLFLVGIGINSATMLLGCLVAILSSLVTARLLKYDLGLVDKGFYSFNAALVGIAVFYFLPFSFISLVLVIVGAVLSALLMHFMITKIPTIPALTTPFILSTWLIVLIIDYAGLASLSQENQESVVVPITLSFIDALHGVLRGVGQVILQDNWLTGAVFCCALLFNSYKAAVWAILAALIGFLVAIYLGFPQEKAMMGLYVFNGCLVAIALSDSYPNKYGLTIFAILLSVLLTRAFDMITIPALTVPFVITTWLMVSLVKVKST